MSLIGSLEDLNLGDILQIISLSQKSGVLVLRAGEGEGRIAFRGGLVSGAVLKDGPHDLRDLLVGGGFVSDADFDVATAECEASGGSVEDLLIRAGLMTEERLDGLRREVVESAVIEMFRWSTGEFSFDMRESAEPEDPRLILPIGVNAQYLAMEGARVGDEGGRDATRSDAQATAAADACEADGTELSAHAMFGVEEPEAEVAATGALAEAIDTIASAALRDDDHDAGEEVPEATLVDEDSELAAPPGEILDARTEARAALDRAAPPPEAGFDSTRPVIVIDADLPVLEWAKASLDDVFERVHIFQRSDLGLARIRQYLARAVNPIVLLSPDTPGDRLSGISDAVDFVRRLKHQAPRVFAVWVVEDGQRPLARIEPADALVARPAAQHLRHATGQERTVGLGESLRRLLSGIAPVIAPTQQLSAAAVEDLKDATARLSDASTRGEVLPLVLEFAARSFERVAMFVVRDGVATGVAQRGLDRCAGPDTAALRRFSMNAEESAWLGELLAERKPVRSAPRNAGDERLARALGDRLPGMAYLAPIESGGHVIAVVYADDLPGAGPPRDTSGLEVVLHHAGLALDRAALERALAEAEAEQARGAGEATAE